MIPIGSRKKAARRIGLARALSKLGYCSRSQAAELIHAGRVRLNEGVRFDPETPVHLTRDRILVDDRPIDPGEKLYLVMNKPRGLITTAADEKGRETVYSLLKKTGSTAEGVVSSGGASTRADPAWVAPVGRLDKASEGLLLLTNDSEWGARMAAPETHLRKTYHVQVARVADEALIAALTAGVEVAPNSGASLGEKSEKKSGGETMRASQVRLLRSGQKNCWLEIVLTEGRNRQIRRMLQALGIDVLRLVRVAVGPLQLGKLAKGDYRPLTSDEKKMLDRAMLGRTP